MDNDQAPSDPNLKRPGGGATEAVARSTPFPPAASHPLIGFLAWFVAVLGLTSVLLGATVLDRHPFLWSLVRSPALWDTAAVTMLDQAVRGLAEEPHFVQVRGATALPICRDVAEDHHRPLANAFNLMRSTEEGQRLFEQLLAEGICVRVGEIEYNSGYAYVVQSITGSWSRSYIMVATRHVEAGEPDVLAAILVHEATHVDRYLQGTACSFSERCTVLPNGVELEEEVAAHGAEAQWWIASYGDDGKRFAFGYDYGMNELVEAYLDGPDAFAEYVREIRGDDREGAGV